MRRIWLLLGLLVVGASPARAGEPIDRTRVEALLLPTVQDPGPLPVANVQVEASGTEVRFEVAGERCALLLFPVSQAGPTDMSSRSLGIRRRGDASTACGAVASRALNRIQAHDPRPQAGQPGPPNAPSEPSAPSEQAHTITPKLDGLDRWLMGFGLALVLLLPLALAQVLSVLDGASRRLLMGAAVLALLIRALAPHRLVMVYFGYKHVGEAIDLASLPRYGPGATMLWWLLMRVAPADHVSVQWLHVVLGSFTVGLFTAWVHRATGSRRAALSVALLLALTPLLVRDHGSESMAVAAVMALAGAAILVGELVPALAAEPGLKSGARALAALSVLLLYAASCRPDLALVALPVVIAFALARHPAMLVGRAAIRAWPFALVVAAAALPIVLSGFRHTRADLALGNLPRLDHFATSLPGYLLTENVLLHARDFPLLAWLPIAVAVAYPATRRAGWLIAAALIAIAPTFVDSNETSNLRLQAPAVAVLLVATGFGFERLGAGPRGSLRSAAVLALVVLSMAPSVRPLLEARNPDLEDALIRRALDAVTQDAAGPARLARPGYDDIHVKDVHLYFPDYLATARHIDTAGLLELAAEPPVGHRYFLRSLRCWLWPSWDQQAHPPEHPACSAMCDRLRCTPLFEEELPNLHDWPTFDGYGSAQRLRVGVYRLDPK